MSRAAITASASHSSDNARVLARTAAETPTTTMLNRNRDRSRTFSRTKQRLTNTADVVTISKAFGFIDPQRYRTMGVTAIPAATTGQRRLANCVVANRVAARNREHSSPLRIRMA